jgi:curli biogenesis system outer membrane secretion channel CsgG
MRRSKAFLRVLAGCLLLLGGHAQRSEAQRALGDGIKDLAADILAKVARQQKHRVAVLPFQEINGTSVTLDSYLSEALLTELFAAGRFEVVERAMLGKLLGEIKLGQTGIINPETARQVGKVAGVDAIITGTVTEMKTSIAVNCRLVDAQTGLVFSAAQTRIVKDEDVIWMLGQQSGEGAPPSAQARGQVINEYPWRFTLKRCQHRRGEDRVTCEFLVENLSSEKQSLLLNPMYYMGGRVSFLADREGRHFAARVERNAVDNALNLPPELVPHVPTSAMLYFDAVPETITNVMLVVQADQGLFGRKLTLTFRNVAVR